MKRIIILAIVGLCISGTTMAQGQKLKGRLIDKDYYPVKNAKVTVKGTNISTTSDKNGNFYVEGVPMRLDSVQLEKGKRDISAATPIKIEMADQVIAKRFSWFMKAGIGFDYGSGQDMEIMDNPSYSFGVGVDWKLSKHWTLQPALYFVHRDVRVGESSFRQYYDDQNISYFSDARCSYNSIELPLLFALKYRLGHNSGIVINMGSYVAYGVSGTASGYFDNSGYQYKESFNMFDKDRFAVGLAYGVGFEFNHILVGASGRLGILPDGLDSDTHIGVMFEIGYRF